MNDLISRQAAIHIASGYCHPSNIAKELAKLPSAEPEIIYCRDCKHRGEAPNADGMYWCEIHDTFMYYCSDAERRTDE